MCRYIENTFAKLTVHTQLCRTNVSISSSICNILFYAEDVNKLYYKN